MTGKQFILWLEDRGWVYDRPGRGSHLIYRFPTNNAFYVVLGNHFNDTGRKIHNMKSKVKRLEKDTSPSTAKSCCYLSEKIGRAHV